MAQVVKAEASVKPARAQSRSQAGRIAFGVTGNTFPSCLKGFSLRGKPHSHLATSKTCRRMTSSRRTDGGLTTLSRSSDTG